MESPSLKGVAFAQVEAAAPPIVVETPLWGGKKEFIPISDQEDNGRKTSEVVIYEG